MTLISLLVTWLVVQLQGMNTIVQRDSWFLAWAKRIQTCAILSRCAGLGLFISVLVPLLLLVGVQVIVLIYLSPLALIILNVPILLYSFGRSHFQRHLQGYMTAWRRDDAEACIYILMEMDCELPAEALQKEAESWTQLHLQALRTFAYSGFERMFSVLFWFVCLGATGALMYRLSSLYLQTLNQDDSERSIALKWLWLLEWPAVRVLGLSWAMVGNFVGCFTLWREHFLCLRQSSSQVLLFNVQGALGLDISSHNVTSGDGAPHDSQDPTVVCTQVGCSGDQIEALQSLLSRALLLWISVVAFISLFF